MTSSETTARIAVGPAAAFDTWAGAQISEWTLTQGKKGFSPETGRHYRRVWDAYVRWLGGLGEVHMRNAGEMMRWTLARRSDVQAFLDGAAEPQTRQRKTEARLANFSSRAYWRVLCGVYASAHEAQFLAANPLLELAEPKLNKNDTVPQFLDPAVLQRLRVPSQVKKLLPATTPTWIGIRNQALVALVSHCGLTAGELRDLKGEDLRLGQRQQMPIAGVEDTPDEVDVAGRTLRLPAEAREPLLDWLDARIQVLDDIRSRARPRSGRGLGAVRPSEHLPLHKQPLFPGRDAKDGVAQGIPPVTTHLVFAKAIGAVHADLVSRGHSPEQGYRAKGPASLRNTVIRQWVRDVGAAEAAKRAGLQSVSHRFA